MWEFKEHKNFYVVKHIKTHEEYIVLTRICAIQLSAKLNEYELKLKEKLQ